MPAILDLSLLGEPVPVGQIGRELKKLWDTGEAAPTRASLINFAVYCRSTEALAENTELISQFTRSHACRALLICVVREAPEPRVSAWINAHCHLSRAGAKQVCCEQISFLLEGEIKGRLTNIVFAHLDSDLPLYFWWQGDLAEDLNPHLWSWIDRLIVDSLAWREPRAQFARLRASLAETKARLTLRDLNWTRSLALRQALSQIFDHPGSLPHLRRLRRVVLTHAPTHRSTALLLLGWLAAQLGWTRTATAPLSFADAASQPITADLRAADGPGLGGLTLASDGATFTVQREAGSHFLHASVRFDDGHEFNHLYPAGADDMGELLDEEMGRASNDRIYLRALTAIEPLL